MSPWLKVLCAVDFSTVSRPALEQAVDLVKRFDAELTLLHVVDHGPVATAARVAMRASADTVPEMEGKVAQWRTTAEDLLGRPVKARVVSGSPAEEILRVAEEESFDVVVVGTGSRVGSLARLLLGSVAEKVVRSAPCPVLVARPVPWRGE